MPKIAVIYKSKYGATRQYAEWIADEIKGDFFEQSKVCLDTLLPYETIVFGGPLQNKLIKGIKIITTNYDKLMNKKIIIFCVGLFNSNNRDLEKIAEKNLGSEIKSRIPLFYCPGRFNFDSLSILDKTSLNFLKEKLESDTHSDIDDDTMEFLNSFKHPVDLMNKKYIIPVIERISY